MKNKQEVNQLSRDITIKGANNFCGGEFDHVFLSGFTKMNNNLVAKSLRTEGVFKANGEIFTEEFSCSGVANITGHIKATHSNIDGTMKLKGEKFESEKIICSGVLSVEGEINADNICSEGVINAYAVYGDFVTINSVKNSIVDFFENIFFNFHTSKIGLIEATTVSVIRVKCNNINGHDITIGKGCVVKNIYCDGSLYIHPTARVENISGDYIRK